MSVHNRPVEKLSSSEIRQAARVAPAWNAIPPRVRAELAGFRKAANARLGPYTDLAGNEVLSRVYELSSNIAQAEQLADRHVAVEAARVVEQHVEAQRREAAMDLCLDRADRPVESLGRLLVRQVLDAVQHDRDAIAVAADRAAQAPE